MINTILITGCTQGLGFALARAFASEKCRVWAVGRDDKALTALAENSRYIEPIIADIATSEGRANIVKQLPCDVSLSIIHNAAIAKPCRFTALDEELLRLHLETNLIAPLLLSQQLLPRMREGERILHISSGAAELALPGLLPYCTSKAAMAHAMRCLDQELVGQGIHCANLRPGLIDTRMEADFREAALEDLPGREFYVRMQKEGKLRAPEWVALFVVNVLQTSDEAFTQTAWNIDQHWNDEKGKLQ